MVRHTQTSRSLCLELTQQEGRGLLDFIQRFPADLPAVPAGYKRRVAAVEEALGDAQAVAIWLHENVHLDMNGEEAVGLLATMTEALGQDDPPPSAPLSPLLPVKRKLIDAVGCASPASVVARNSAETPRLRPGKSLVPAWPEDGSSAGRKRSAGILAHFLPEGMRLRSRPVNLKGWGALGLRWGFFISVIGLLGHVLIAQFAR